MPLAKVAITLRRDEHPGFDIQRPGTGRQFRNDEVLQMGRGIFDRVAVLKARLDGARRLHFPNRAVPASMMHAARQSSHHAPP